MKNFPGAKKLIILPFPLFLVGDFIFLAATVFSRNLLRWKVIKFHIIQACSRQVAARQFILETNTDNMNKIFERKIVNIFLPISLNICFGCSKEPSR